MSAGPSPPTPEAGFRRNVPRHGITVPLDVIRLRSGIPDTLPGRCTDISEAGIGAAVAGELALNQHVAIELKLPQVAVPLRARAIVRHRTRLQCGLQFVNLSVEQREMIRFWANRNTVQPPEKNLPESGAQRTEPHAPKVVPGRHKFLPRIRISRRQAVVLLAVTLVLAACLWLYWEWSWRKLERSISAAGSYHSSSLLSRISPPVRMASRADL
jgi:PilZ domain-containing protein